MDILNLFDNPEKTIDLLKLKDTKSILLSSIQGSDGFFCARLNHDSEHPYIKHYSWSSPVAISEIFRQLTVGVAREFYTVPPENDYALTYFNIHYPSESYETPIMATCQVDKRSFSNNSQKASFIVDLRTENRHICTGVLKGNIYPVAVYKKIREKQRSPKTNWANQTKKITPKAVFKNNLDEVLISTPIRQDKGDWRAELTGDDTHPYFYYNTPDHIPGAMIFEAAIQAVLAIKKEPFKVKVLEVALTRFLEINSQKMISVEKDPKNDSSWKIRFSQDDKIGSSIIITEL